jgi:hypothetical protein
VDTVGEHDVKAVEHSSLCDQSSGAGALNELLRDERLRDREWVRVVDARGNGDAYPSTRAAALTRAKFVA